MRSLMLLSSSFVFGKEFLEYCLAEIGEFLGKAAEVLFVPFAYPDHESYTSLVQKTLGKVGAKVVGAQDLEANDVRKADFNAIFCGGGNTFLLLKELYDRRLTSVIRRTVLGGAMYIGSSAGANVACPTIGTTNDMPIVFPRSLKALNLIPFNINPHYYEKAQDSQHMGESRKDRILEFQKHNQWPVLAMKEGAIVRVENDKAWIAGIADAVAFIPGVNQGRHLKPGSDASFLVSLG